MLKNVTNYIGYFLKLVFPGDKVATFQGKKRKRMPEMYVQVYRLSFIFAPYPRMLLLPMCR
jgi:hypothetical protein